ncbi:MAG TPA: chromate efflux transporter [Symbiobacteriaceae bacterium]|nr:chromate efflux transporter [Symbiobacteriaceae bacterium]
MAGNVRELAGVFFRLGATSFGGPAAHIANMYRELVERRKWLDRQTFLDLVGASNLVPGPTSTEVAIHVGYYRAGWVGLVVAGACFIVPAVCIVLALAFVYVRFGTLPQMGWMLYGVKPVILAIVAQALWGFGKTALKGWSTNLAAGFVLVGSLLGFQELALLFVAGAGVMLAANWRRLGGTASMLAPFPLLPLGAEAATAVTGSVPPTLWAVTLFFLKVGSVLYGSGYVLLAFLQGDLVERWGWITSRQLLDAIAVGQFTPGPVFTTATFIGYLVGGVSGSLMATLGIFLPSFLFVGLLNPLIPRMRQSLWLGTFLDGVNAASLGLMAAVTIGLGRAALTDWITWGLALVSLAVLIRFKINSAWLVLAGGVAGWLVSGIGL